MPNPQRFIPEWRSIVAYLRDGSADWKPKALLILAILYLVWPIDLVPDLAPILGWLDDIGGMSIATLYVLSASKRYAEIKRLPPSSPE